MKSKYNRGYSNLSKMDMESLGFLVLVIFEIWFSVFALKMFSMHCGFSLFDIWFSSKLFLTKYILQLLIIRFSEVIKYTMQAIKTMANSLSVMMSGRKLKWLLLEWKQNISELSHKH